MATKAQSVNLFQSTEHIKNQSIISSSRQWEMRLSNPSVAVWVQFGQFSSVMVISRKFPHYLCIYDWACLHTCSVEGIPSLLMSFPHLHRNLVSVRHSYMVKTTFFRQRGNFLLIPSITYCKEWLASLGELINIEKYKYKYKYFRLLSYCRLCPTLYNFTFFCKWVNKSRVHVEVVVIASASNAL